MGVFRRIFGRREASDAGPTAGAQAQVGGRPHTDGPGASRAYGEAPHPGLPANETTERLLDVVRTQVWSGFCRPRDVHRVIHDLLENGADEAALRAAAAVEFRRKAAAERAWPGTTDCDRLNQAFADMNARGIIALQNAGYTMSDGLEDVSDALQRRKTRDAQGYCFYHSQDVMQALRGRGLLLAFGVFGADAAREVELGHLVKRVLEGHGLVVAWDGDPATRLHIPDLDWQRRFVPCRR